MSLREQESRQRQRRRQSKSSATFAEPARPSNNGFSRRVMTLRAWCELNGFSLPTGRRIIASGRGPKITQLGERRVGIREDHNAEWQDSRIREFSVSAAPEKATPRVLSRGVETLLLRRATP